MRALVLVALAALAVPAAGQGKPIQAAVSLESFCVLHTPTEVFEGVNALRQSAEETGVEKRATFDISYTGFSQEAEAAFQFAADIWAAHLESPQTIRVQASFEPLGTNVLGTAGSPTVRRSGNPNLVPNTWYPLALYDALTNSNVDGTDPDIIARFSSNFPRWYFGTDGLPGTSQVDFVSVVLHELGHGLGFFGTANVDNGTTGAGDPVECNGTAGLGCIGLGSPAFPIIFDRFIEDASATPLLSPTVYPNPSAQLGAVLEGGDLFWDSPTTGIVYSGRPPIWAPALWEAGSSFSHWDENVIRRGDVNALMTPQIAQGEAFLDPGPLTCALMQDIGWALGDACLTLVETPTERGPLAVGAVTAVVAGSNPFHQSTAVRVEMDEPQTLRASLVDALGREVQVLHNGPAADDLLLRVSGGFAPGVYVVRVEAENGRASVPLTRVR